MAKVRSFLRGSVVVALVSTVGGCGTAVDLVDPPTSRRATAETTRPMTPGRVETVLEAARQTLRRDRTGQFAREVIRRGPKGRPTVVWQSSGRYDLTLRRSQGTATVAAIDSSGDDGSIRFEFATGDGHRFVHANGWRCWLALARRDPSPVAGLGLPRNGPPLPGEIAGLLRAEPSVFPADRPDVFDVYVPLPIAAALAGLKFERRWTKQDAEIPIVAQVRVRSGRFVSWSIGGIDLMAGMKPFFGRIGDREFRTSLRRTEVRISVRDADTSASIELPPRSDWVRLEPGTEDFDPNGCGSPIV